MGYRFGVGDEHRHQLVSALHRLRWQEDLPAESCGLDTNLLLETAVDQLVDDGGSEFRAERRRRAELDAGESLS